MCRICSAQPFCFSYIILVLAGLLVSGCATVTKGTSQAVTVTTDPAGARCTLTREGTILAVIQPTPGSIEVKKGKTDIAISCELAGYKDNSGMFESRFADMTMGNVLFGGVVGVVIDASSGASYEYDPIVTLTMIPLTFPTVAARDVFFDKVRDDFLKASAESLELIAKKCKGDRCDVDKAAAEKARDARIAEIENERQIAKIDATGADQGGPNAIETTQSESVSVASTPDVQEESVEAALSPLIGNWKGEIRAPSISMDISMQINAKITEGFTGHASVDGGHVSCKRSEVSLAPLTSNNYKIILAAAGCAGEGSLAIREDTLNGKINFSTSNSQPLVTTLNKVE